MKKFFNLAMVAVAVGSLALYSCGGDGDDAKPKPTVTLNSASGYTYQSKTDTLKSVQRFNVVASHSIDMKKLTITLSTNGGTEATLKDTTLNTKSLNYIWNYTVAGSVGDKLTIKFTVTDKDGESDSKSVTITVSAVPEDLGLTQNQVIWNIQGPNIGAYNLVSGSPVPSADPDATKDIVDGSTVGGGGVTFTKSWITKNGSKMVKVGAADWGTVTNTTGLVDLWNSKASSATGTVTNLATGDIILVKSGQTAPFPYFLIKIDGVTETPADNLDKITFSYKSK